MGRNRYHEKDYWISFPTTIHMSKSKWKRLRYLGHNFWSNHWIFKLSSVLELDIHTFPLVTRSAQLEFGKAFKWAIEFSLAQCVLKLNDHKRSITPLKPKKEKKRTFRAIFWAVSLSLSLPNTHKNFWILTLPTNQELVLLLSSLSPWSIHLGFEEV